MSVTESFTVFRIVTLVVRNPDRSYFVKIFKSLILTKINLITYPDKFNSYPMVYSVIHFKGNGVGAITGGGASRVG